MWQLYIPKIVVKCYTRVTFLCIVSVDIELWQEDSRSNLILVKERGIWKQLILVVKISGILDMSYMKVQKSTFVFV